MGRKRRPQKEGQQMKYNVFKLLSEMKGDYDLLIVMDANMVAVGPLDDFVNIFMMSTMDGVVLKHPNCDSVYDDLALCEKFGKGRRFFDLTGNGLILPRRRIPAKSHGLLSNDVEHSSQFKRLENH